MVIKAKLFFRNCERRKYGDDEYFQCRFLDENDNAFVFRFPCDKEHEKYLSMHKDTLCELDLLVYSPKDKSKAQYCLLCS